MIHFNVKADYLEQLASKRTLCYKKGTRKRVNGNFFMLKDDAKLHSFTVFPKSGSIIATGISKREHIDMVLERFLTTVDLTRAAIVTVPKVINSTYTGQITCSDKRASACHALARYNKEEGQKDENVNISFRSQFFPGVRLRLKGKGTINLFNNGKYILVGMKEEEAVSQLYKKLCAITQTYWTTTTPETRCAWIVV